MLIPGSTVTTARVCIVHDTAIIRNEILRLKKDRNAIILAHNYQKADVQDIADLTGDSLELSRADCHHGRRCYRILRS